MFDTMRRGLLWSLLAGWVWVAPPTWAVESEDALDVATSTRLLHEYGLQIDHALRLHAMGTPLEEIEAQFHEAAPDLDLEEATEVLGRHLVCNRDVHGLLQQLDAWDDRLQAWMVIVQAEEGAFFSDDVPWLRTFGTQPLLLRFVVSQVHAHCPQAALQTFDQATALPAGPWGGDPLLREALHALTRAGLALAAGEQVSARNVLQSLQVLERGAPFLKEFVDAYREQLEKVALSGQTPRWDVDPSRATPRAEVMRRYGCGFVGLARIFEGFAFPLWPHPVRLLESAGHGDAAAAWALADLFKEGGLHHSGAAGYDAAGLIRRVHGQASVRAALQQAADELRVVQQAHGTLAWITLYGQSFVINAGGPDDQGSATRWWTADEIRTALRASSGWQQLWGTDEAGAAK